MRQHLLDAWHTVAPPRDGPHGPLPALLVAAALLISLTSGRPYGDGSLIGLIILQAAAERRTPAVGTAKPS
jgi:hypothetical protein